MTLSVGLRMDIHEVFRAVNLRTGKTEEYSRVTLSVDLRMDVHEYSELHLLHRKNRGIPPCA